MAKLLSFNTNCSCRLLLLPLLQGWRKAGEEKDISRRLVSCLKSSWAGRGRGPYPWHVQRWGQWGYPLCTARNQLVH